MKRRTLLMAIIGSAALVVALIVARAVATGLQKSVLMASVVVAREVIPPYTLITGEMLTTEEYPREVTRAAIYTDADDLIGKVARTEIMPHAPIYRSYAVAPAEARLSDDLRSAVVSLKVDTARAVGGLVAPGHRVDVWRVAKSQSVPNQDPDRLLAVHGASVELLARDLRVLAVSSSQGLRVAGPDGSTGLASPKSSDKEAASRQGAESISVVAVEAGQDIAPALVRLMGEVGGSYDIWLTLSPLERDPQTLALAAVEPVEPEPARVAVLEPTQTAVPTSTPQPTMQPAPAATPTVAVRAGVIVRPGPAQGLNVRSGPGTGYPVVAQLAAGTQLEPLGRDGQGLWLYVCCVGVGNEGTGWVLAELVELQGAVLDGLPVQPAPKLPVPAGPTPTVAPTQTATAAAEYQAEVTYRNEPGEKKLNYVRTRALDATGHPVVDRRVVLAWPDGAVRCPGDVATKEDGWCEFVVTEGAFDVRLEGEQLTAITVSLPQNDQHTIATVTWRRVR